MMQSFGNVLILPTLKIHELQEQVEIKTAGRKEFTNIERSEALESLGIAQFYNGDYAEAISNLEAAIAPRYIKLKAKRRVAIVKTLLGSLYYRFGDLQRAELLFATAGESCRKIHDNVLWSITLSNLAVVQLRLENSKDAEKNAKAALDLVQKIYSKKCAEYLQAVRVLVCIYLRLEEYAKAEGLVEDNEFPPREKAIVLAGISFAQSDFATAQTVLLRCIENESKPHVPVADSPRRPPFMKTSSAASATELYNPWSKYGNNVAPPADPSKPAPLIQPTPSYMDGLNEEMLGIMIRYNLSILKTKNIFDIGISDTIEKLEKYNKSLHDRRGQVMTKAHRMQTINKAYPNGVGPLSQDDPYLKLNCDQHPQYMGFDAFMFPSVALSVMLTAQSEFDMLTAVFGSGMAIESGHISGDVTGLEISLRQIQQEFKNALTVLQSSLPTNVDSRNGANTLNYMKSLHEDAFNTDYSLPHTGRGSTPGTARGGSARNSARGDATAPNTGRGGASAVSFEDSMVSSEMPAQNAQPLSKLLAPVQITPALMKEFEEIPDLLQAKYSIQQFQILTDLVNKQIGGADLANSALTRLREEHHVFVHPNSGKLFTGKEIEALLHPKPERTAHTAHNTHTPHTKTKGKKASAVDSSAAVIDTRPASPSLLGTESDEGLDEHALKLKAEAASAAALTALATVTYNASKLHGGALHSDIMPLAQPFGKDQATLWIEWALSKAGALSFGFLGQSCMDPLPDVGFNLVPSRSAPPTPAADATREHQKDADDLLLQVRCRLLDLESVLSTPNENSKLTARGVRLEARVIVFILLCKVTVQLDLKKEAGQCVLQLEDVCLSLRKQQCDSLDSLVYHTFAMRFRMDYEEWCISPTASDAWVLGHLVHKVLPVTKQYVNLCKQTGDIFLQRDALKRLINVYSEAGGIVLNEGSDVASLPKERVAKLTPSELETYEANMEWVQKNGANRALVIYEEMHKLASSVST